MGDPWIEKQNIRIMKLQHIVKQFANYTFIQMNPHDTKVSQNNMYKTGGSIRVEY